MICAELKEMGQTTVLITLSILVIVYW